MKAELVFEDIGIDDPRQIGQVRSAAFDRPGDTEARRQAPEFGIGTDGTESLNGTGKI